ncbi:sugar phosphate/phosphate translocator [Penicillium tannophilum]|uniref:Sugar phosphate/phosphate translocator n=1 Tax=Penicillium frequentans TaxID=3151616 RepID=A0AAD6GGJ9_9EURO|nr:sugar phosphate/phosphate translocator [Penicillium glabrum]KAJ5541260.1 sugar phosphate/phosphate translocator [Penicillium glabrum]KAJ5916571.1 sugar phosphate/phosphate translocator [Penicillium tannophilum]
MSSDGEKVRTSGEVVREQTLPTVNPAAEKQETKAALHPAVYVSVWITLSSSVILFNKYLLDYANFRFPIVLTTWHLTFATIMTQILARTTTVLDGRKTVKMTGRVYLRAIVPIGLMFSLSLICGNMTYLYLSVAFIQMLKATTPVAVLLATWGMGMAPVNYKTLMNVSIIVVGVVIASFGEIKFVMIGFLFQLGGIVFEATRLVMVQRLLSSAEFKMDPMVSLYYFAPICAVMNGSVALFLEVPNLTMDHIYGVGVWVLVANAMIAFLLNVSVVFLIGKTSSLVMTLCGVLKDILLVAASMMLWNTPVSALQFFGYSVALVGLVYYKLGGDKIREYTGQAGRAWAEYGNTRPAQRKFVIFGATVLIFFLFIGTMAPGYAPESVKSIIGGATPAN